VSAAGIPDETGRNLPQIEHAKGKKAAYDWAEMKARLNLGWRTLWAALACLPIAGHSVASDPYTCKDSSISIVAASQGEAQQACSHAEEAKVIIVGCGLTQTTPIRIELVEFLEHGLGACLGSYDCAADVIRVVEPSKIPRSVEMEPPYSLLPVDVVFKALIAHELAHALLEQSSEGTDIEFVDHEFVAAVMELETMAPEWREVYLAAAQVSLPPKVGLISAVIYGFDPRKFAVNAWQFFRTEPDGCERIHKIAAGSFTFANWPR